MNNLLIDREYQVEGSWYAPVNYLKDNFKSVVKAKLVNTCNSYGNWDGYFVQKIGKKFYLIAFSQENEMVRGGLFTLFTLGMAVKYDHEPTPIECEDFMQFNYHLQGLD